MSEPQDGSLHAGPKPGGPETPRRPGTAPVPEFGANLPFDLVRLAATLVTDWFWLLLCGGLLAGAALVIGMYKFETGYWVTVQLIRREASTPIRASMLGDAFKPRQVTVQTIVNVMQSPKLLDRVGGLASPPLTGSSLARLLKIKPEKDTDLISVTLKSRFGVRRTAELVNLYAREAVGLTAQMQSEAAAELDKFLSDQIAQIDTELAGINKELLEFSRDNNFYGDDREVEAYLKEAGDAELQLQTARSELETVEYRLTTVEQELARQDPAALKLNQARSEWNSLRAAYTDASPLVKNAADKVAALEKQIAAAGGLKTNFTAGYQFTDNPVANDLYLQLVALRGQREGLRKQMAQLTAFDQTIQEKLRGVPAKSQHHAEIVARQQTLQATRDLFSGRQHEAQIYEANSPGLYRLFSPATDDSVETSNRWIKIILAAIGAFLLGLTAATVGVLLLELMDLRVVSAGDLRRVTELPVFARLPETAGQAATQAAQWRFCTWAQMIRQLGWKSPAPLVLAFTSIQSGEGKSTLIRELHLAALDRHLPVVVVTNSPLPDGATRVPLAQALTTPELLTRHVLATPDIPLELYYDRDWQWTLENRNRWQRAARVWHDLASLVLLVELPPMDSLDAVLAAELMSRTILVTASGRLQQRELADALEMVEAGEVNLVATMLNREPAIFPRLAFLGRFGLFV